jgi:hypothetical protein
MRTLAIAAVATLAITAAAITIAAPFHPASASGAGDTAVLKLASVEQQCGGADLPPMDGSPRRHPDVQRPPAAATSGTVAGAAAWFCPYVGWRTSRLDVHSNR